MADTPTTPNPISPIPPGPDGGCPQGYVLNSVDNMCYLVGPAISVTATGVSLPDVDPKNAGELTGLGIGDSQLPERLALAHWHALKKSIPGVAKNTATGIGLAFRGLGDLMSPFVNLYMDLFDAAVSAIASFLSGAKTRDNPFFWQTIGDLISDLLGVTVDGAQLFNQLQSKGTLAAMQGVGAGLINLLIGEFTGTASGTGGEVTFSSNVNATTGLPEATLSPAGGVKAAQALMGFVLSSSVRQANIEGLTANIPYGFGTIFEKYSEAMRTNLGIGRMLRFALRPIMQIVAEQLKWAFNLQYRPKMLNPEEAARRLHAGIGTQDDYLLECAMGDGLTDSRALSVLDQHTRHPDLAHLITLRAAGVMGDAQFDSWLGRDGYDSNTAALTRQAADLDPARRVALALSEHYLLEFGKGNITPQALKDFIDGLHSLGFMLSPGEVTGLEAVATKLSVSTKLRIRQLQPGALKQAFIDGTITLDEYEAHLAGLGYSAEDVQTLGIEVLLAAKKAAAAAAKHAAAGKKGTITPAVVTPATPATPGGAQPIGG